MVTTGNQETVHTQAGLTCRTVFYQCSSFKCQRRTGVSTTVKHPPPPEPEKCP